MEPQVEEVMVPDPEQAEAPAVEGPPAAAPLVVDRALVAKERGHNDKYVYVTTIVQYDWWGFVERTAQIRVIVNRARNHRDGEEQGIVSAYCTPDSGKCPSWVNNLGGFSR